MAKVIVVLLPIVLVASLLSGCYQAPASAPAPTPAPPQAEKAPAPVITPTEKTPAPVSTPPEKAPAPAAFTTSNLTISPTEVDTGKNVTISVLVTNTGGLSGSHKVTLKIDNIAIATEEVTLSGGTSRTVTFTTIKDIAGIYTVNIDSLSGIFTVKKPPAPAAFTTSNLTISPAEVDAGKSVTISVRVTNTGDLTGRYSVILKIDNLPAATENITLSGGASRTVTFTTTKDVTGTYTVNIDGLSGTFTVKTAPTPVGSTVHQVIIRDFSFSSNQITINVGDTVTWTNQGSDTHTVTGSSFDSSYLASGRSWSYTFKVAGSFSYRCAIHPSMQGQVTVGSGGQSGGQSDGQNGGGGGNYSY